MRQQMNREQTRIFTKEIGNSTFKYDLFCLSCYASVNISQSVAPSYDFIRWITFWKFVPTTSNRKRYSYPAAIERDQC